MRFIGADPDLQTLSLVAVDENSVLREVLVIKNLKGLTGRPASVELIGQLMTCGCPSRWLSDPLGAMAVESQEIAYSARSGANPRDLLLIAPISGALVAVGKLLEAEEAYLPTPQAWKGSVKKWVHHRRIFTKMGWECQEKKGYCCPAPGYEEKLDYIKCFNGKINPGDWKHITDSVGLALYAKAEYDKAKRKREVLNGKI
jgi:hypothetical protein